ncbi:hypothetical protein CWE04_02100 [Thomasclavelia cocleata]|nr:hypothetical protein CWE04_02100 [Thomasclavelia cocleata]
MDILIPLNSELSLAKMRKILSENEIYRLIKTFYLNKLEQIKKGKKFHAQDMYLLETAEKCFHLLLKILK